MPAAHARTLWHAPRRAPHRPPHHAPAAKASAPIALGANPKVDLANFSRAGGEWTIDWAKARRDAQAVLAKIDMSKRDIVIYVPGTSNHKVMPAFEAEMRHAYGASYASDVSMAYLEYESTWHMRRSAPTGLATLELVLDELRKRKRAGQRIFLSGESQGSWIISEAMANPAYRDLIERAAIVGHPWLAKHHFDANQDPSKVLEINHEGDQVTLPVKGNIAEGLDAMIAIRTMQLGKIGLIAKAILANPLHGWLIIKDLVLSKLPIIKQAIVKPHIYEYEMPSAVAFLHDGVRSASLKPALNPAAVDKWKREHGES
jgi:hypothetical protein